MEEILVAEKNGEPRLSAPEKEARYAQLTGQLETLLADEPDLLTCMVTIACVLHAAMPHFSWTGFYRRVAPRELLVGPYQGTLGCFSISFDRGVCGACARERRTLIVPDVERFPGHIACDATTRSEIVVPVFDAAAELVAVLDVDSRLLDAFDALDQRYLERIAGMLREKEARPVVWAGERRR